MASSAPSTSIEASHAPLTADTGNIIFGAAIASTIADIDAAHPELRGTIAAVQSALASAFAATSKNDPAANTFPMFAETSSLPHPVLWALAHCGFVVTRAPGDAVTARVFAKPAPAFVEFYQLKASEADAGAGGASSVK